MIVGVINGYYRSGTTITQRLYKLSHPDHYVLSEPTQHEIIDHALANGCFNTNTLHGWTIFEDYCRLPRELKHDFIKRHFDVFDRDETNWGVIVEEEAVKHLFDSLHKSNLPVVIKSTQLQLFLSFVAEYFDCWVLHLDRATDGVIASHFSQQDLSSSGNAKKILFDNKGALSFYAHLVFDRLSRVSGFDSSNVENNLDKLVYNIEVTRAIAREQAKKDDKITFFDFDKFVRNPTEYARYLPFKLENKHLSLINPSKQKPIPRWLSEAVAKSKAKLGFA